MRLWSLSSLRLRLTLWFLVIFAAVQIALALVMVSVRDRNVRQDFDNQLAMNAEHVARAVDDHPGTWSSDMFASLAQSLTTQGLPGPVYVQVREPGGEVLHASTDPPLDLPAVRLGEQGWAGGAGKARFSTVDIDEDDTLFRPGAEARVVTIPFMDGQRPLLLQVAASARPLEESLGDLWSTALIGVPLGIIAAGIAGWFLSGQATRPLQQLGDFAKTVSPRDIKRRLKIEHASVEVERLQDELNSALERLEQGYRAQEDFISNVSHELKTPVAVLLTESQVLRVQRPSAEDYERYVTSVEEEMRRLGQLTESFLMLARAGHGKRLTRRVNVYLYDVLLESIQHSVSFAEQYEVKLKLRFETGDADLSEAVLRGDPELVQTMFDNLIRNAVKFSPPGAAVDVELSTSATHAVVSVRDRGPGIPPAELDRIFDRFTRASNTTDHRGRGTGLGLAIAKRVVELHRGEVTVENCPDTGARFTVRMPLRKRRPEPEVPPPAVERRSPEAPANEQQFTGIS